MTVEWSAGYVTDVDYTFGYYNELNPVRAQALLRWQGLDYGPPKFACELGFGQGLSANVHAAASGAVWYGTDFNPTQALFAQSLATASGSGADLRDQSFAEFCSRQDLPDFDYIGLHGIWTWISDENRAVIVDFVRRKLKVGGVLYISYNMLPGWATGAPLRHLMTQHAEVMSASGGGVVPRIDAALQFAEKLLEVKPAIARLTPQIVERLKKIKAHNRHYIAHEYFNRDWKPMYFSEIAEWLTPAKLSYAGSAHFLDHVEGINLTADQQKLLNDLPDPMFQESVRDFLTGQQFRRDYWIKGSRKLPVMEREAGLRNMRVLLVVPSDAIVYKATGLLGEAALNQDLYRPIIELMADHQPRPVDEIWQAVQSGQPQFANFLQCILILIGKSDLAVVQDEDAIQQALPKSTQLNQHLLANALNSSDVAYLATPVTGGAISVPQFQQLFLLAIQQGHDTPQRWAEFAWALIKKQGRKLSKEGKTLQTDKDNIDSFRGMALEFEKKLPLLRALKVI